MMRRIRFISEHDFTRVEFDWLAHDKDGRVGFVTTAGAGPVPEASLADAALLDDILGQILALPVVCEAKTMLVGAHDIQIWQDVACRGLYGFDWRRETNGYRLIASPSEPLILGRLGQPLRDLAGRVRLQMRFDEDTSFDGEVAAWQA